MPFLNTRQLKEHVLARASEPLSGSQFNDIVVEYLNRAYTSLASGANEYTPEYVDDWWWLKSNNAITLDKPVNATATLTNGSTSGTFAASIATSMAGRRLVTSEHDDLITILTHTAGTNSFTTAIAWGGKTGTHPVTLYKVSYTLAAPIHGFLGPLIPTRGDDPIDVMEREDFLRVYPLHTLGQGIPQAAMLLDEQTIWFSHGGVADVDNLRVTYAFKPQIIGGLTDDPSSEPTFLPKQWRHILCDMALPFLLQDKNDDRLTAAAAAARSSVAAMVKENRRRQKLQSERHGHIWPRLGQVSRVENRL